MTFIFNVIFYLFVFGIRELIAGHILPGPQTLLRRAPYTTTRAIASGPTAGTLTRVSNSFQNITLHTPLSQSHSNQYNGLGSCTLGVSSCSAAGVDLTYYGTAMKELPDECLLWDDSCSGNRTLALKEFFNESIWEVRQNACFMEYERCKYNPPGQAEAFSKIKNYLRSPQCVSNAVEYGISFDVGASSISSQLLAATSGLPGSCCWQCELSTSNVDIYYWPEPDANTSCLSIVGDAVNPLGLGATTDNGVTYWGCKPKTPLTVYNAELAIGGPPGAAMIVQSIITTAMVRTYGGIKYKQRVVNPWSSQGCGYEASEFKNLSRRGEPEAVQARGKPLVVRSITEQNGLPVSTVVSGGFTLYVSEHRRISRRALMTPPVHLHLSTPISSVFRQAISVNRPRFRQPCSALPKESFQRLQGRFRITTTHQTFSTQPVPFHSGHRKLSISAICLAHRKA